MKKILFAAGMFLAYSTPAFSGTAKWTGNQVPLPPSSGYTVKCEYEQGIIKFWRLMNEACPQTVQTRGGAAFPTIPAKSKQDPRTPAKKTFP